MTMMMMVVVVVVVVVNYGNYDDNGDNDVGDDWEAEATVMEIMMKCWLS